MTGFAW